jgi:hypothetical protein
MGNTAKEVFGRTSGRCHFCGDPLVLGRHGKSSRGDGAWEMDHIHHSRYGGGTGEGNLLPACTACNRLRWHAPGRRMREILEFGLIARREAMRFSELGCDLLRLRDQQRRTKDGRRGAASKSSKDPVADERLRSEQRKKLISFLNKRRTHAFRPAELKTATGVPKWRVRSLLDTEYSINWTKDASIDSRAGGPSSARSEHNAAVKLKANGYSAPVPHSRVPARVGPSADGPTRAKTVKLFGGVTDFDWYTFLAGLPDLMRRTFDSRVEPTCSVRTRKTSAEP